VIWLTWRQLRVQAAAVVVGVIAAIAPARRASQTDVLEALHQD